MKKKANTAIVRRSSIDQLYVNIRDVLEQARNNVYQAVNSAMVQAYWQIGRIIVEEEQKGKLRAEYGQALIHELAQRLAHDYGKGFNERNLWYMRSFYLGFPKMNALRSELTWTHYRLLLRLENEAAREFYIIETIKNCWSTRELERQIDSLLFERLSLSKDKTKVKELTVKGQVVLTPHDIIKDPYVLEFLDLKEKSVYLERNLEQALIDKMQQFLLELGKGFSYVARQKRITVEGEHYHVDLVFYNYILKCFVLVDLKIGKLTHQDIGQMDFYVRYFEQEEKQAGDNPTIGLILCSDKNETMVKYTLLAESKRIFASKYKLYLPTEKELKKELDRERGLMEVEKRLGDKGNEH